SKDKFKNKVKFAWWSAEEFGLLGSEAYVASRGAPPCFPGAARGRGHSWRRPRTSGAAKVSPTGRSA
ncbi:M28 family peptidase, partial [Streptomyces sp. NPDC097619]|uniref:M28 family peptidase n=1 Tax=Streptomyces sp. NPDC097619 TaxID=3157228 RepID=UPI00332AA1F2